MGSAVTRSLSDPVSVATVTVWDPRRATLIRAVTRPAACQCLAQSPGAAPCLALLLAGGAAAGRCTGTGTQAAAQPGCPVDLGPGESLGWARDSDPRA